MLTLLNIGNFFSRVYTLIGRYTRDYFVYVFKKKSTGHIDKLVARPGFNCSTK